MAVDFSKIIGSLLSADQTPTACTSDFIRLRSSGVLTSPTILKLSANNEGLACRMTLHRSLIKTVNTHGPIALPCMTPDGTSIKFEQAAL